MATLNLEILATAHADGLLPKRLTQHQTLYLRESVMTANKIYWAIASSEMGLNLEQLQNAVAMPTKIHLNTLTQFTRWMISKKLIYAEGYGLGGKQIYFATKRVKAIAPKLSP